MRRINPWSRMRVRVTKWKKVTPWRVTRKSRVTQSRRVSRVTQ
jgi:hypothetical protein